MIADGGSIQRVEGLPSELKQIYRTVWEIKQRSLIDMAAERGVFIDQSQSLNAFLAEPDYQRLTAMHFHAWKSGLKTGMCGATHRPLANRSPRAAYLIIGVSSVRVYVCGWHTGTI